MPAADDRTGMGERYRSMRGYARDHPAATGYVPCSLARVAQRVLAGEDAWFAVREFLDDLDWAHTEAQRAALIRDQPPPTGDTRTDALLGALGEHVAVTRGLLPVPTWCRTPERFLERWWFPAQRAFDALAVAHSPAAFRRRGIFIVPSMLERC